MTLAIATATLMYHKADDAEFGALYQDAAEDVLRFHARRTASAEVAADLTAETFAAALLHWNRFRGDGTRRAWVFGIARNLLRRYHRRERIDDRARRRLGLERFELDDESIHAIEELADLQQLRRQLDSALGKLSLAERDAVLLRIGDERSYEDIATRLDCSPAAARVRVSRALTSLRRDLDNGEDTNVEPIP